MPPPRSRAPRRAHLGRFAGSLGRDLGLLVVGVVLDVVDQAVDRGLDAVEHRLGVDAEEDDEPEQRCHHEPLPPGQVRRGGVVLVGLAVEHALVGPQQVEGGQDHPDGRDDRPPPAGEEGADEDEELAGEAVEAREPDRAEHHEREHAGEDRRRPLEALERRDLAGVAPLVDHPDEEEERAGGEAVVHHLHHAALDALGGEGEGAEDDEAEVGDRRVGDEPLQVALHRGDDGAVEDADHAEGHHRGREPHRGLGEEVEAEANEPVGAELQHDAGQDHGARGGGLGVGVGQPGVQREQRHLDRERDGEREEDPSDRRPVEGVGAGGVVGEVLGLGDVHEVEVEVRVPELVGLGARPPPVGGMKGGPRPGRRLRRSRRWSARSRRPPPRCPPPRRRGGGRRGSRSRRA